MVVICPRFSQTEYQLQMSQWGNGLGIRQAASTDADRGFSISASNFRRTAGSMRGIPSKR